MHSLLISRRNQGIVEVVSGLGILAFLMLMLVIFASSQLQQTIEAESRNGLEDYVRIPQILDTTFAQLTAEVTAAPCTLAFQEQLRRVVFRADSINEVLFAPGGVIECSSAANFAASPLHLHQPDILLQQAGATSVWLDYGLGFAGLQDLVGTIALREPFAVVMSPIPPKSGLPSWLELEIVLRGPEGRWWHRSGEAGLYERYQIASGPRASAFDPVLRTLLCPSDGYHCAVTEVSVARLLAAGWVYVVLAVAGAALVAAWSAGRLRARMRHYWSFEARFVRHLDAQSISCVYQPIMDLKTGDIAGCEVLARWRDMDGALVYPDRFIPLVERRGLTLEFTRLVVERAHAELTKLPRDGRPLFLTFNIFPRDLDGAMLASVFDIFAAEAGRFDIIVELVESDAVDVEVAQREIVALRALGIRTFIDDFGAGYSNIQALAALSVDGVKLDRAFAMAPVDGMMSQMLAHAIGMIHIAGRAIVVEGVETPERLDQLRAIMPAIDYVQGYYISRPLDIAALAPFLADSAPVIVDLAA